MKVSSFDLTILPKPNESEIHEKYHQCALSSQEVSQSKLGGRKGITLQERNVQVN